MWKTSELQRQLMHLKQGDLSSPVRAAWGIVPRNRRVVGVTQQGEHRWKGRPGLRAVCDVRPWPLRPRSDCKPHTWTERQQKNISGLQSLLRVNDYDNFFFPTKALAEDPMFLPHSSSCQARLRTTGSFPISMSSLACSELVKSCVTARCTGAACSCRAVRPSKWDSTSRKKGSPLHLSRLYCWAALTNTAHRICACLHESVCMLYLKTNPLACKLGIWGCSLGLGPLITGWPQQPLRWQPVVSPVPTPMGRPASALSIFSHSTYIY